MATRFCRSAATGTGDGSSWANAYTTLAAALSASAAGDTVLVADDHAETSASAVTLTSPGTNAAPCLVLCADHTVASPGPGHLKLTGSVTGSTLTVAGSALCYGLAFIGTAASSSAILFCSSTSSWQKLVNCSVQLSNTGTAVITTGTNGSVGRLEWSNSTVKFAGAANSIKINNGFIWRNTPNAVSGVAPTTLFTTPAGCLARIEAVDLSFVTGTIVGAAASGVALIDFKDCKVNAAATLAATPTAIGPVIQASRTDSAATNYKTNYISYRGAQSIETSLVRTGGASADGATTISWKIATTANVSWASHFEMVPIPEWNTLVGSARTVTVRGIWFGAALPTNDQIWIDLEGSTDTASPLGSYGSGTKANALATGTALAADSSAWDSQITARANSTSYTVGQLIKVPDNPGRVFQCITAGAAASSEPAGFASAADGTTVTDGGATFRAGYRFAMTAAITAQQTGYVWPYVKFGGPSITAWVDPVASFS